MPLTRRQFATLTASTLAATALPAATPTATPDTYTLRQQES